MMHAFTHTQPRCLTNLGEQQRKTDRKVSISLYCIRRMGQMKWDLTVHTAMDTLYRLLRSSALLPTCFVNHVDLLEHGLVPVLRPIHRLWGEGKQITNQMEATDRRTRRQAYGVDRRLDRRTGQGEVCVHSHVSFACPTLGHVSSGDGGSSSHGKSITLTTTANVTRQKSVFVCIKVYYF